MKVAILAGGLGTRLEEETITLPKPLVTIGGKPIIWHIMKIFSSFGFNEFVIATGYKQELIKDYFLNYRYHCGSLSVDLGSGEVRLGNHSGENWLVHILDTGLDTLTGGRVRQIAEFIGSERFMLTYGDGLANIDLNALITCHEEHKRTVTVTAVRPTARFGEIRFSGNSVTSFHEKPVSSEGWINGGFFVMEPEVSKYIDNDFIPFERDPMERLSLDNQLAAYKHADFWQCMDTLRDKRYLEQLWHESQPWKVWS